ncbi:hypothetical protein [Mangrovimonas sp. DI 80]|uniref:hypothetical protein n=1 Tax=Mangrovimonas sp. DI 80 TaxID=1779330 RepID=UPI00097831D5|nr:hypothetical protein [Mangrovimonas sp. DI 80]OMP30063.1 hypothetical protein BKM32_14390 [Mangrovimonas sp. DI 80]
MEENQFKKSRRDFIKLSSLGAFALHPTVSALANWLNVDKQYLENSFFDDDFHYFGNNLTNLHFYFIGAKIKGKKLLRTKKTSFMVVKIPQQHVQEQLLRAEGKGGFDPDYINSNKRTDSKISGFSFLAFEIKGLSKDLLHIDVSDISILLEWDNPKLFELLVPQEKDYKDFQSPNWANFKTSDETLIEDNEANPKRGYIGSLYKNICDKVFRENHFPLTVLEIPEGLLVSPYNQNLEAKPKAKAIAKTYRLPKERFIYNDTKGKITRTVEEIWSTQLFFETVEGQISPPLRAVGYIPREGKLGKRNDSECPDEPIKYLPTLLDKKEIVYLTSLGRGNNINKEWDIETRGLTLTGLGAIAKFHYKNFNPPYGTDLAEYEHHFSLGRDEYIKVARIGVISVTGQKALHIKIGQRKIKKGTSYMEFKEYIEIIQKDIIYFDKNLCLQRETNFKEPENYIQARKVPPIYYTQDSDIPNYKPKADEIIHSIDLNTDETDNTFRDNYIWNIEGYLPKQDRNKNWHTKYSRWPFKRVIAKTFITPPINSLDPEAHNYTSPNCDCAELFWPVLEKKTISKDNDCYLNFIGIDWNEKEIQFTSTFLFIRKKLIECDSEINTVLNRIYDFNGDGAKGFIYQKFERRTIRFTNQEIAFTPDFSLFGEDSKEEFPNKSNVAKTDYLEYYFSICVEPKRTIKVNGAEITIPTDSVLRNGKSSIFNERLFPLFPQVKKVQLYVENIQGYSPEPLPSIIEYNDDYINYGFERRISVTNKKNNENVEVIYNKARLIFNHTEDFIKNDDRILEFVNGKWEETTVDGYSKIKQVFSGAGSAIGGLVNPDFDIQSIGLVKQSLAVGKEINKKYEGLTKFDEKFKEFNPSDLLRQAPEILNGISLIDILQEVFPEYEAPVNEIKNVASQVEQLNTDLIEELKEIKKVIEATKKDLFRLKNNVENVQAIIDKKEIELKTLRDELNNKHQFSDLSNLIKSVEEYSKIIGLEFDQDELTIDPAKLKVEEIAKSISTQILSQLELILKLQIDIKDTLKTLNAEFVDLKPLFDILNVKYNFFVGLFLKDPMKPELGLKPFNEIVGCKLDQGLQNIINNKKVNFGKYYESQQKLNDEKIKLLKGEITEISKTILSEFKTNKTLFENPISEIKSEIKIFKETTDKIINRIKGKPPKDFEKLKNELISIEAKVRSIYEIILSIELSYVVESFEKAKKEYEISKAKICQIDEITREPKITLEEFNDLINSRDIIKNAIKNKINCLEEFFNKSKEFNEISITNPNGPNTTVDISKVIHIINSKTKEENTIYQDNLNDIWLKILSIEYLKGKIEKIEGELYDEVNGYKVLIQDQIKQYENKLKENISQESKGVVGQLKDKIKNIESQIIDAPSRIDLRNLLIQSKQLYNTLTSITKKEINYNWQTYSFKNADFGPVSFLASNNPRTSLSVTVKNVINFEANKFPPVIKSIDTIAENRLSNFGISLYKAIIINFNEVSFVAGTNRKPKFEVKIRDVQFAGAFAFVQKLESLFKDLLGDNFSLKISPQNVEIEYLLPIKYLGAPSFGFEDFLFRVLYTLYFDKRPMELGVGIGSPANRTRLKVGVYTGFFYFIVIGNPKQGITTIEVSIEFGGYYGLSLGPLRGEVKLVVGLYYRKDLVGVFIEGYFLCLGRVKLWCFTVSARFYMGIRSQGGYVEGRCTVSYKIKISRFFTRKFSSTYYKKMAGATPENNQSGSKKKSLQNLKSLGYSTNAASEKDYENPIKRIVSPISASDWDKFITSYTD